MGHWKTEQLSQHFHSLGGENNDEINQNTGSNILITTLNKYAYKMKNIINSINLKSNSFRIGSSKFKPTYEGQVVDPQH